MPTTHNLKNSTNMITDSKSKRTLTNSNLFCVEFLNGTNHVVPGNLNILGIGEKLINCHWSANALSSPCQYDFNGNKIGSGNLKMSDVFFVLDNDNLAALISLFQTSVQIPTICFIVVRKDADFSYVRNVEIKYYNCVLTSLNLVDINDVLQIMDNGFDGMNDVVYGLTKGLYDLPSTVELLLERYNSLPSEQLSRMYVFLTAKYNYFTTDIKQHKAGQVIGIVHGEVGQPGALKH